MKMPQHLARTALCSLLLAIVAMANLPPQLVQTLPEIAAASVSQLCEMAPGIPRSSQILDDMVETLKLNPMSSKLAL